jgi:hypothetical protein
MANENFATDPDEDDRCAFCRSVNGDVRDIPLFPKCYQCYILKNREHKKEIERELE